MTILLRFLPHLIGLGLLIAGWLYADRACWSSACKAERSEVTRLKTERDEANARAAAITVKLAEAAERANVAVRHERNARAEQGRALRDRARNLDRSPVIAVSPDAARLLLDASRLANSAPAPIRDQAPTVAVPGFSFSEAELVSKWADAALAYADARGQWLACVNFYEGLRNEQARISE